MENRNANVQKNRQLIDMFTIFVINETRANSAECEVYVKTKGKTAKKAIDDAVKDITKELDKVSSDFKKMY